MWRFPGVGEVEGQYFFNDNAPLYPGESLFGSANWHKGDGTDWPPYGEIDTVQHWRNGSFPDTLPDARTVGPLDQIAGDSPIDPPERPGIYGLPLLCWSVEMAITLAEVDGIPTYAGVAKLYVNQADGFVLSQPAANQARLDLAEAAIGQRGIVSLGEQYLGTGAKYVTTFGFALSGFIANNVALADQPAFSQAFQIGTPYGGYGLALVNGSWLPGAGSGIGVHTIQPAGTTLQVQSWLTTVGGQALQHTATFGPNGFTAARINSDAYYASGGAQGQTGTYAGLAVTDGLVTGGAFAIVAADVSDFTTAVLAIGDVSYQPLDADLTAIAALATTSYGRGLLTLANQAALQAEAAGGPVDIDDVSSFGGLPTATLADDDEIPFSDTGDSGNNKVSTAADVRRYMVPPGTVMQYAGSSVPSGWLDCDGSAVSRTTYAALFSAIGITWGPGDGSTTFNVPDLRGRAAIGVGTGSGLTNRVLGVNGGSETQALTTAELASHTHTVTDPGHSHLQTGYGSAGAAIVAAGANFAAVPTNTVSNTTGITIGSAGSGNAHNNMQPFANLYHIIKT